MLALHMDFPLLRSVLLSLSTSVDEVDTPDDTPYRFLCTNLSGNSSTFNVNDNAFVKLVHPNCNRNQNEPEVHEAARLTFCLTFHQSSFCPPREAREKAL